MRTNPDYEPKQIIQSAMKLNGLEKSGKTYPQALVDFEEKTIDRSALDFSNGFPVYGGKLVTYAGGYLFAIYLAVLFSFSGIPPAIAEQGL